MSDPQFPPLFDGRDAEGGDPFSLARAAAKEGCDAGLVIYDLAADTLRAAIVFAPEVPLTQAVAMLPVCAVGLQNALGAIGPPEVAVQLGWQGEIYVNGGRCGELAIAAPGPLEAEPDWLVVGLTLKLWPDSEETGLTPDETALYAEGCADIDPVILLEAWIRHTLVGINAWSDDGMKALHREWSGLAYGLDDEVEVAGQKGVFVGLDENLGLLLKQSDTTQLIPLTATLTRPE